MKEKPLPTQLKSKIEEQKTIKIKIETHEEKRIYQIETYCCDIKQNLETWSKITFLAEAAEMYAMMDEKVAQTPNPARPTPIHL